MNALELSPLTIPACVRRVTHDLHTARSESAMCAALSYLGAAAEGRLSAAEAEAVIRGLAAKADPDGYAESVRQLLALVEVDAS